MENSDCSRRKEQSGLCAERVTDIYKQIPEHELIIDRWYLGRGRNSNIGQWTGKYFLVIAGTRTDQGPDTGLIDRAIKQEPLYTNETGCFQPFVLLDEGRITAPFGKSRWDTHYGSKLQWPSPADSQIEEGVQKGRTT